jgi:hypothetical protein
MWKKRSVKGVQFNLPFSFSSFCGIFRIWEEFVFKIKLKEKKGRERVIF